MGLKRKGFFTFLVILIPSFIIIYVGSVRIAEKHIMKADFERVSLITDIVKNGLVTIMLEEKGRDLKRFLDNLIAEDIEGIYILDKYGNVISSTTSPPLDHNFLNHVMSRSWKDNFTEMLPMKINEKDIYSSIIPLYNERPCQKCHGSKDDLRAILHVEISRTKTLSKIRDLKYQIALVTSFVFLILIYLFYRFNLETILKPIVQMKNNIRRQGLTDIQINMDELQTIMVYINELSRNLEIRADEIRSLKASNTEILERLNNIKRIIMDDLQMPLSKILASMEAYSEENSHDDLKREILKTFVKDIKRLIKTMEDLNQS